MNSPTNIARARKARTRTVLTSISLLALLAAMQGAAAASTTTRRMLQVEHVRIDTPRKFAEVEAALERAIPALDPAIRAALVEGDEQRARQLERGALLFIFLKRDSGELLRVTGRPARARQYEIGNPLTATRMTRHRLAAALYAPLRVLLYENEAGGATFEYDRPSTLFGQFDDEQVAAVARELDDEIESALRHAAE